MYFNDKYTGLIILTYGLKMSVFKHLILILVTLGKKRIVRFLTSLWAESDS
jgi:hypothetical protein